MSFLEDHSHSLVGAMGLGIGIVMGLIRTAFSTGKRQQEIISGLAGVKEELARKPCRNDLTLVSNKLNDLDTTQKLQTEAIDRLTESSVQHATLLQMILPSERREAAKPPSRRRNKR